MDQNTGSSVQRGSRGQGRGVRPSAQGPTGIPNLSLQPETLQQPQTQLQGVWAARRAVQSRPTPTAAPPVAGVINASPVPAVVNAPPVPQSGSGDVQGAPSHGGAIPRASAHGGAIPRASASAVRGRRVRATEPAFRTKPEEVISKKGNSGKPIALKTNHLRLRHSKQVSLQQYRVDFVPELDNTKLKKGLFRTAFREVVPDCLFDGTVVYSTVHFPEPVERLAESTRGERFQITMRPVGSLAWGDYQYIPVLNIIVRKCLRLMNFELVRREYFDPQRQIPFQHEGKNFNVWPGFFTSMRQCEDDLLLNTDVLFKVMREGNVFDLFLSCAAHRNAREALRSQVIGTVVMTKYNNKTYRIDDVDFDSTPQTTFAKADGTRVSLQDYYRTRHCINIKSPDQPLLVSRASRREIRGGMSELIWLVPELCTLTGLTDQQRENFQMMRELGRITRLSAPRRVRQLTEFARRINADPNATRELRTWDVGIADSLLELQGRLLPMETVRSARAEYSAGPRADWGRELRTKEMFRQNKIRKLVVITPAQLAGPTNRFLESLRRAVANMSWTFGHIRVLELENDHALSYINKIDAACSQIEPDFFLIVLPRNSLDRYAAVKQKCTCDRGVLTQFVLAKQLAQKKNSMSIATNIAIQMNAKHRGAPWSVDIPLSDIMVIGYDVSRDTVNEGKCFGAMLASMDPKITQFRQAVFEHKNEEELSDYISQQTYIFASLWKKLRGYFPKKILFYRDGVGDGQLEYVRVYEVEEIVRRLTELYGDKSLVKLAFVVVSKRINVKFFTKDNENPSPGTVVDTVVTQPERYDFYLTSQCVNQGTVSPTSYNIIYDTMGLPSDKIQILTYKLTHMYFNWSGTIKVPAPVQYAHKLAFQTSQALHRPAHAKLQDTLHFL